MAPTSSTGFISFEHDNLDDLDDCVLRRDVVSFLTEILFGTPDKRLCSPVTPCPVTAFQPDMSLTMEERSKPFILQTVSIISALGASCIYSSHCNQSLQVLTRSGLPVPNSPKTPLAHTLLVSMIRNLTYIAHMATHTATRIPKRPWFGSGSGKNCEAVNIIRTKASITPASIKLSSSLSQGQNRHMRKP
jgi:hypothetical protein